MRQATLRTERLTLVPLTDEHLEDEIALDAIPEVMRFLGPPRDRALVERRHVERLNAAHDGLGFWAGTRDDVFVGWWLLEPDDVATEAELGYRLRPEFWRQGLAVEGAGELVRHAFVDLGLERVFARTMAVNVASRATMTSVGLTYVRTFHESWDVPLPGSEQGEVEYAISREQWWAR